MIRQGHPTRRRRPRSMDHKVSSIFLEFGPYVFGRDPFRLEEKEGPRRPREQSCRGLDTHGWVVRRGRVVPSVVFAIGETPVRLVPIPDSQIPSPGRDTWTTRRGRDRFPPARVAHGRGKTGDGPEPRTVSGSARQGLHPLPPRTRASILPPRRSRHTITPRPGRRSRRGVDSGRSQGRG